MPVVKDYVEAGFPAQDCWAAYAPLWQANNNAFRTLVPPGLATVFSSIPNPSVASNNPVEKAAALFNLMVDLEARCDAAQSADPIKTDGWRWNALYQMCQSLGPSWNKLGDLAYSVANRLLNTGFGWSEPGAWATAIRNQSVDTMGTSTF